MEKSGLVPDVMKDSAYLEPDTVRIVVKRSLHDGKVWQHMHNFYEFVYVDSGFTLHGYNGKTSVLTDGDLFAIFPGDVHSYISAYHTSIYNVLFYLEELGDLKAEVLALFGLTRESVGLNESSSDRVLPIIRVGLAERRELVGLLERMRTERQRREVGWELNLKAMLIEFLVMYSRLLSHSQVCDSADSSHDAEADRRGYNGYIYSALKFIEDNYSRDISAGDIAGAAGLSTDYLARRFKAVLSMTPAEYVRKFRVAKSIDLLKTTNLPIAEIAVQVGFGDNSLYSRVFKQVMGVSPVSFRRG